MYYKYYYWSSNSFGGVMPGDGASTPGGGGHRRLGQIDKTSVSVSVKLEARPSLILSRGTQTNCP
jgi:hypothetical protein